MEFIHAVVFDKEEYKNASLYDLTDWGIVCDGDYVVHALYDCENQCVIKLKDNMHDHIVDEILSFCEGIRYTGKEVYVTKAYVVVDDRYSWKQTCEKITNGEYQIVTD